MSDAGPDTSHDAPRERRLLGATERWTRLLLALYPADFRDEMGRALVDAYRDRARDALRRGGAPGLALVWLRALGDSLVNGLGERLSPAVAWRRGGNWGRDTERVLRRLVRAPAFVLSMVGTLAVGLGAFGVVYAVVHTTLLAPLPYERPQDLYYGWRNYTWVPFEHGWLGGTDVAELRKADGVIEDVVGMQQQARTLSDGAGSAGGAPQEVTAIITTPNVFQVLGVRMALGRGFLAGEAGPGRPDVAVLSWDLWQGRFGGDRAIVGRQVRLNDRPFTVIGVTPRGFRFVRHAFLAPQPADVWVTHEADLATLPPNNGSFAGIIRVRPGTTPEALLAAVASVSRTVDQRDFRSRGMRIDVVPMKEELVSKARPALVVLGVAGTFLLVVLGVNLATLLLVRAAQREREFAISRALGANRVALVRATLLEGALLGALGGAMGALVAVWGTRTLVALAPLDLPRRADIAVDWRIALTVIAIGAAMGLVAAAVPATWAARASLASLLANSAVRGGGGGHGRMRRAMVVVQVALSLVLLCAGGLVVRSFEHVLRARPGFEPAGVLTLRVPVSRTRYADSVAIRTLHDRLLRELAAIPGVTRVGAASALPLTGEADQSGARFPGAPGNTGEEDKDVRLVDLVSVRGDYFETLGIRLSAGRPFATGADGTAGERTRVIIDRQLANAFYPGDNPIGRTITVDGNRLTVVGVVEQARMYDAYQDGREQVYVQNEDWQYAGLSWAMRSDRDPASLAAEAQAAVRRVDPELAVSQVRTMATIVGESMRQQRASAVLIGGFSLGALLLASMGLFGVVAGAVSRRRHELAVRLALGADHGRVLRLVLGEGARLVALGLLVGVPGVWFAGRLLTKILIGVSPYDGPTLGAVALGLGVVTLAACWLPARRVAGIEPSRSLREG